MTRAWSMWLLAAVLSLGFIPPAHANSTSLATLSLESIDGKPLDAAAFKDKVVMVVNVASFCSYTPQYAELQALYERFATRGLVVLGVPSNQFGAQEPGSNAEIKNFCSTRYGITFPMLAKQDVNGPQRSALYTWLIDSHFGKPDAKVAWNFEKFLVDRSGKVVGHFGAHITPSDPTLITAIEFALATKS